jgi:hypothetical protein
MILKEEMEPRIFEKWYMNLNFYKESLTNLRGTYSLEIIKTINKKKCFEYQ